jgi:50S ribosomal protein L16 3-hydroxylase
MDINQPLPLLGGLTAAQFMRRHWQKKPLLIRQAIPGFTPPISRAALFELAGQDDVESRLIRKKGEAWQLRQGPLARRVLPPLNEAGWTMLVQGVDLHHDGAHELMRNFRFLPDARVDDLMISYASNGGGVGPHFDSYDVFLLQAHGTRRWSIGRQRDLTLQKNVPLKILENFEPEQTFVLEPGDMLYLPPRYAHDGVAETGDCMTYSIGLRAPAENDLAADLLVRIAEAAADEIADDLADGVVSPRYRDPGQMPVTASAAVPETMQAFAREAVLGALRDVSVIDRALGESLTEPKPLVWFESTEMPDVWQSLSLDKRTRMLYDEQHLYINGESFRAAGRDATLMRRLADQRALDARELKGASEGARELLGDWCDAGWVHAA